MDFLLQQFGDMLKAEAARAFQQDDLVVQLTERGAGQELRNGGEK